MWSDHLDPLRYSQTQLFGLDEECAEPLLPLVRHAGEHYVEVGDSRIGDPGLFALQHVSPPLPVGGRAHRAHIRAGSGFGQGKGGDRFTPPDRRQHTRPLRGAAKQGNRRRSQALHGEREVGQSVMPGQSLPRHTEGAHVVSIRFVLPVACDERKPPALGQSPDDGAAGPIQVSRPLPDRFDARSRPRIELQRKAAVPILQKRPVEKGLVGH